MLVAVSGMGQTYNGYTLYSKIGNTKTYLIDMQKNIYHQWTTSGGTGYTCYLLPGGTLLRSTTYNGNILNGAAMTGTIQKYSYAGTLLWSYTHSASTYCLHHDIYPLPNGNVLAISYEVKSAAQVSAAGCSSNITMWPDKIIEIQPTGATTGTIVWEWHIWDHLVQQADPTKPNYGIVADHPELLNINWQPLKDWMHTNGLSYNPELDQITFSCHNLNEIFVIDHSTTTAEAAGHTGGNAGKGGDLLFRWGNPQSYGRGTSANKIFNVVHDAHWIPANCPNAGNLVAFNNKGGTGNTSRIDMIAPPHNGYNYNINAGAAYAPSTPTWSHSCLQSAQGQSNSQPLPNGNMLVCISTSGYIYEIDANQNLLWYFTAGASLPKAFRYTLDYINGTLTSTATASPANICNGDSTQLFANPSITTGLTFSWTSNPAGFTSTLQNPIVNPVSTTSYYVTMISATDTVVDTVTVTVNNIPATPSISQVGDTLFSSASGAHQWYLNGTLISGATASFYIPFVSGSYSVTSLSGSCASPASAAFGFTATGMENIHSDGDLQIFPNPTTGMLYLYGNILKNDDLEVEVYGIDGMQVLSAQHAEILDLSGLKNGVYYVVIHTNTQRLTKKISLVK
jgi:hypothetical protein